MKTTKSLLDICEENENWYEQIDHCADILCKFVEGNKCLPKKLCLLHLTNTISGIMQEFYEKVLVEPKDVK